MHDQAQDPRHPGQINRVQMYSGRRMSFLLSFVFLFPCSQDTGKQKRKNTENTACKGCGPEEFGGNTGIDQTEINQDQHRRNTNDGQNNGYDVKRYLDSHECRFLPGQNVSSNSFQTSCHYYITFFRDVKSATKNNTKEIEAFPPVAGGFRLRPDMRSLTA